VKRRLELPDSLRQRIDQLPLDRREEIGRLLEHIQSGNPMHLAPFAEEEVSLLLRDDLARYRVDIEGRAGHLCSCQGGGYRFFVLDAGHALYVMAMEPRPDLHPQR
jgi:hypothetical protein